LAGLPMVAKERAEELISARQGCGPRHLNSVLNCSSRVWTRSRCLRLHGKLLTMLDQPSMPDDNTKRYATFPTCHASMLSWTLFDCQVVHPLFAPPHFGARRKHRVPRASSPLQRRWRLVKSLNGSSRPLVLRIPDRRQSPWFPPQRENFHGAAPLCGYLRKAKCLSPANKFPHTSVGFRCCAMRESVAAIS
jgi:hypothetical protein